MFRWISKHKPRIFLRLKRVNLCHSLYAEPLTLRYIRENFDYKNAVIVSPDAGGAKRATALADRLDLNFALIHKERSKPNEVSRMTLVGDVTGKIAILVDDMADTCGTLCKAAEVLVDSGAKQVVAIVTHGILSGDACEKVEKSKLSRLVVTDTVPHEDKKLRCSKLATIDVAPTVSDTQSEHEGPKADKRSSQRHAGERTTARVFHTSSTMSWFRQIPMDVHLRENTQLY